MYFYFGGPFGFVFEVVFGGEKRCVHSYQRLELNFKSVGSALTHQNEDFSFNAKPKG